MSNEFKQSKQHKVLATRIIAAVVVLIAIFVAFTLTKPAATNGDMIQAKVTIIADDGNAVAEKTVDFNEGTVLLDILESNFAVEEKDGFVSSIEELTQDESEGLWWVFDVNGEMGMVGANEYEVLENDHIEWKLMKFE